MNENLEALYQSIQRNTDNIFPDELVRLTPEQLEEGLRDERNRFGMFSSMQRHYPAKFGQMKFEDFSNALGYEMANWDDSLRILQEEQARERGIHIMWVSHDLCDPRVFTRQAIRDQVNAYMRTVMREEPLDPSLENIPDNEAY